MTPGASIALSRLLWLIFMGQLELRISSAVRRALELHERRELPELSSSYQPWRVQLSLSRHARWTAMRCLDTAGLRGERPTVLSLLPLTRSPAITRICLLCHHEPTQTTFYDHPRILPPSQPRCSPRQAASRLCRGRCSSSGRFGRGATLGRGATAMVRLITRTATCAAARSLSSGPDYVKPAGLPFFVAGLWADGRQCRLRA